jgi:branched-chain amino acid transport system ATP-binding protein
MVTSILSTQNLRKSFGNLKALDGVSLELGERKIGILIGPNGSGKTTLINVVTGIYPPDSGKTFFDGNDVTGVPPHKLFKMGMARTFQIPALFWKLTVLENLLVAEKENIGESFLRSLIPSFKLTKIRVKGKWNLRPAFRSFLSPSWEDDEEQATAKAWRVLELLGLSKVWYQSTYKLSGGQMKLLEIGRALMSDAKLLLLDEPISGVNPTLAHEIFVRILKLRDSLGLSFFIVEHRLDIAMRYVDETFAMALGQVIASGPPDGVLNDRKVIESYLGG